LVYSKIDSGKIDILLLLQGMSIIKIFFISFQTFQNFLASKSFFVCLFDHENSKVHRECFNKGYELALRLHIHQTVDEGIQRMMDKERKKWRAIIRTIIDIILFLGKQKFFSWPS